jgi:integrase
MLDREHRLRDRALFDLAIDSKLRGCDLVKVRIGDLVSGGRVRNRATVIQQKTKRPVQFELLEPARSSLLAWLERRGGSLDNYAFPSRVELRSFCLTPKRVHSSASARGCTLSSSEAQSSHSSATPAPLKSSLLL